MSGTDLIPNLLDANDQHGGRCLPHATYAGCAHGRQLPQVPRWARLRQGILADLVNRSAAAAERALADDAQDYLS